MGAPDFRQIPTTKSTNSAPSSNLPASTMAGRPQVHFDRSSRRIFMLNSMAGISPARRRTGFREYQYACSRRFWSRSAFTTRTTIAPGCTLQR